MGLDGVRSKKPDSVGSSYLYAARGVRLARRKRTDANDRQQEHRLVELTLDNADVIFSDNYFDLPARRTVAISCPLPLGWTLADAQAALRVRSVYDSFACC